MTHEMSPRLEREMLQAGGLTGMTADETYRALRRRGYSQGQADLAAERAPLADGGTYRLSRHQVRYTEDGFMITPVPWDDGGARIQDEEDPEGTPAAAIGHDLEWVRAVIRMTDAWLDGDVAGPYKDQPLAQDWGRTAKVTEEIGEAQEALRDWRRAALDQARVSELDIPAGRAIEALIGYTGQNPRKGVHKDRDDVLSELTDIVCTGLFAIQHFTKDEHATWQWILTGLAKALSRVPEARRS